MSVMNYLAHFSIETKGIEGATSGADLPWAQGQFSV